MKSIHKIQSYPIYLLVLTLLWSPITGQAQVDERRMQRDVRIMQQALNEMLRQEYNWEYSNRWSSSKDESRYIPEVGIVLIASNSGSFFGRAPQTMEDEQEDKGTQLEDVFKEFLAEYGDLARELPEDESILLRYSSKESGESYSFGKTPDARDKKRSRFPFADGLGKITAKVSKEDVMKFRRGELDRDAFDQTIEFTRTEASSENPKEFKIFSQILKSLFESDRSSSETIIATYFDEDCEDCEEKCESCYEDALKWNTYSFKTAWGDRVDFERIEGLGAIYDVSLGYYLEGYNSIMAIGSGRGRLQVHGDGWVVEEGEESEDDEEIDEDRKDYLLKRDEKLEEIYGDFIQEMKEAMVLYGRTLRSLKEDEFLIVRAELPACYECELPANVEFKVQRSVLNAYDERDMDYDEIEEKIQVTEEGDARKLANLKRLLYNGSPKVQVYSNGQGKDIRIIRERDVKKKKN